MYKISCEALGMPKITGSQTLSVFSSGVLAGWLLAVVAE
jgi:hypothetical protein